MMKDRRYGGSSRLRSPSPRRRGFSPPRIGRIEKFGHSSPRGRRFEADEEKREGRYPRRDDYRRQDDRYRHYEPADRYNERNYGRSDHDKSPSHGGTRLSSYDDAGVRDRDRDDTSRQLYQTTGSDGNNGRRLSSYDNAGVRDRNRVMEDDPSRRLYQPTSRDGDHGRRLSSYDDAGVRDRNRVREGDPSQRLYQPTSSHADHGRRLSSYDDAGVRDRNRVMEGDPSPKLYQPTGIDDGDRGRKLSSYDNAGMRHRDRIMEGDPSWRLYQPTGSDGDGDRGQRLSGYDVSGGVDRNRDMEGDYPPRIHQPRVYGEESLRTYKYGDVASRFQWDDLRNSNGNKGITDHLSAVGIGTRSELEYDFRRNKFVDDYKLDRNPVSINAERGRICSSSYQKDISTLPKNPSQFVAVGGGFSQPLSSSLQKEENFSFKGKHHLDKLASDRPLANFPWSETRGEYREDNLLPHFRPDIDMMHSSSRSKASEVPSGGVKTDTISSSRDFLPSSEVRLTSGSFNYTGGYNEYGSKPRAKSPVDHVDHDGRSAYILNDPPPYLGSTKERFRDYNYPTGGHIERGGMGTRSSETYRKVVDVVEDSYGPLDVSSMGTLEPSTGNAEGSSDQGYLRGTKLLEPLNISLGPRPKYYDAHELVERRTQEANNHHYGSPRSSGSDSYYGAGISRLGELDNDYQAGISWPPYKQADRLHDSILDNFEHRQRELILDKEQLSKPPKRTFEREVDTEMQIHRRHNGGTWDDLRDAESWRDNMDNMDSKFLSKKLRSGKSIYGKGKSLSNLIVQHPFSGTGSVSGPSNFNKISGRRDIKKRLGPVPKKLPVSQRLVNKYKPSVKKRLGPGLQNKKVTPPPWLRKRNVPNSRRIQDAPNGGFADEGGGPQEDDVTQTKLEPPENSEDFKQMVSSAFLKFVKQLNETPAKRRKYMEHVNASSLKCLVCGSVSEEFGDTESLALHAFTSQKVGVRSQHLGLHKALCVLMGWMAAEPYDTTWTCQSLSRTENLSVREDLILWPPVVIVHNSTIGNQDKGQQVIVSVQELEEKLRDMGFGEKMKVHCGKPANESVMVVQFGATLSGLQEAERLHMIYSDTRHGRDEFQQVKATNNGNQETESSSLASKNVEDTLYGYMGIVEDLHELDFDKKRRCLIKSKKDIQDIAEARFKA